MNRDINQASSEYQSSGTFIVTIGRQLGSGGKIIGGLLSKSLNIPCYDKELIQLASRESGLGREFFEKADENDTFSLFGSFFSARSGFMGDNSYNYLCNETLFKIQSDVIRDLAGKESCIFVGRCADYILRDHPRSVHIFIHADEKDRIRRVSSGNNITEKEAKALIEQTDKKRSGYYNYYSNKIWGMSTSYDLSINSSVLGIDATAVFLEELIKRLFPGQEAK
ncbi:MAG: cytidylate kinase-like family protein [Dysgonamonadaceae bacterium]|jgi:cytidylate kinase|nr:cytidylate kinase-like family protein [Dysgonamonadaceae bacterium]